MVTPNPEIPLAVQIGEIEREIAMRQALYPSMVERGKMKHEIAERQLRILRAVRDTLVELREEERGKRPNFA